MMKKVLVAAVVILALTSCKKDWTCECSYYGETESYAIKETKKKDAKAQCEGKVTVGLMSVGGNNCTLK